MVTGVAPQYGQCMTRVDFDQRAAEPRNEVKGLVARTTFYMFDRYNLTMSRQQQQLLMAWDKQYPVSSWEEERDRRIAGVMGYCNPFVAGERRWSLKAAWGNGDTEMICCFSEGPRVGHDQSNIF
ncbi:Endonuclease-1 precursor [compost metagenome]